MSAIPAGRRPEWHHVENLRAELHRVVDDWLRDWSEVKRLANEELSAFPSAGGDGRGQADDTSVERAALRKHKAGECLAEFAEFVGSARRLDDRRRVVMEEAKPEGLRPNTVELCKGCNEPAPRVKRLDGEPYHHPDTPGKGCWWQAYNRSRGRREGRAEGDAVQPGEHAGH